MTSELTAYVSKLTYYFEDAYIENLKKVKKVNAEDIFRDLKKKLDLGFTIPNNLIYLDFFFGSATNTSGVAFKNTKTGEVVIGYTGSNKWRD